MITSILAAISTASAVSRAALAATSLCDSWKLLATTRLETPNTPRCGYALASWAAGLTLFASSSAATCVAQGAVGKCV